MGGSSSKLSQKRLALLTKQLGSQEEAVQEHALRALVGLAKDAAVAKSIGVVPGALATVAKLLRSPNDDVQAWAAWALAWLARNADNRTGIAVLPGTLSALANLLDSADTRLREAAAAALQNLAQIDGEVYDVPGALTALAQLLGSPSEAVRKQAAEALSDLAADHDKVKRIAATGPGALAALVKLLGSPTEGGQEEATQALTSLAANAYMESIASQPRALAKLLRSPSEGLQKQAAEALAKLASDYQEMTNYGKKSSISMVPGVLAGLVEQLGSSNRGVQQQSAQTLQKLTWNRYNQGHIGTEPGALAALGKLLDSPSEAVQIEAAHALALLAEYHPKSIAALPGVLDDLGQLLWSQSSHLQLHAAKTLEKLAQDPDNQRSIATAPRVLAGLVELLGSSYTTVQENAVRSLAILARKAENKRSIEAVPGLLAGLRKVLRSCNKGLQERAARLLEYFAVDVDNKKSIAATPGLLAALVELLGYHWDNATGRWRRAAGALATLAAEASNRKTILGVPRMLPVLGQLLVSPKEGLQESAATALRRLAGVDDNRTVATVRMGMAALGKLLGSPSEAVQSRAAGTLANLAVDEARSVAAVPGVLTSLMELLGSRSAAVQSQAARALGSLGKDAEIRARISAEPGTLATLTRLSGSPSEHVQKQARRALWFVDVDARQSRGWGPPAHEGCQIDFQPPPVETSESGQQSRSAESAVAILEPAGIPLPDTRVEAGTGEGSTEQGIEAGQGPSEAMQLEADWVPDNISDSQTPLTESPESAAIAPPSDSDGTAFEPSDAPGPPRTGAETELQEEEVETEEFGESHAVDLDMPSENIAARIRQLEAGLERGGALELTPIQSEYLGRLLDREGDLKGLEDEMAAIAKDPGALRYYGSLRQALCWAFLGAQASCSNLVVRQRDKVNQALVCTASAVAGLVPGYGHVASKVAGAAAGFVADFFEGRRAERIARAGGTDGEAIADAVGRSLVLLRKGELSQIREDGARKVASRDFGRMTEWMKDQADLQTIRDEKDLTGEGVIRKLVAAAEPTWAVPLGRLGKAPQTHPPPPPTVSAQAATPTPSAVTTSTVTSIGVQMVTTEELLRRHEELEGRLRTRDEELESERRRHREEIESVKEQMTILKARHASAASTVDAGDGLVFMQARAQRRAVVSSWDDLGDGECYDIDQQVQRLSGKLDDVEGRLNRIEKDQNRKIPAKARRKGV